MNCRTTRSINVCTQAMRCGQKLRRLFLSPNIGKNAERTSSVTGKNDIEQKRTNELARRSGYGTDQKPRANPSVRASSLFIFIPLPPLEIRIDCEPPRTRKVPGSCSPGTQTAAGPRPFLHTGRTQKRRFTVAHRKRVHIPALSQSVEQSCCHSDFAWK